VEATVLVIIHQGAEFSTIHDNHAAAHAALVEFVVSRWPEQLGERPALMASREEDHLHRFFAAEEDFYIIAETELADLEAQLESLCRGKCANF
jgi:hypothetical protein